MAKMFIPDYNMKSLVDRIVYIVNLRDAGKLTSDEAINEIKKAYADHAA